MTKKNLELIPRPTPDKLRIDFIGMAFALAIGELGLEIGKFYVDGIRLRENLHLVTHILLAIYVIASSWVGWQLSKSRGNEEVLKDTFSLSFFILLLDLFLVICYFILVKSIEIKPEIPSCKAQVFWSRIIFFIYIIWDIMTKFIVEDENGKVGREKHITKYLNRAYQAPLCLLIIFCFINPLSDSKSTKDVVCTDVLLLSTFILFRGTKSFENSWKKVPYYLLSPIIIFLVAYLIQRNIIPI